MAESDGTSRRGLLAVLALLIVGAARGGEDLLAGLARNRHIARILGRETDRNEDDTTVEQDNTVDYAERDTITDINSTQTEDVVNDEESTVNDDRWVSLEEGRSIDTEITVDASEYFHWEVGSGVDAAAAFAHIDYNILVRDGPAINFLILREDEFEAFERGDRFRSRPSSESDISVQTTGTAPLNHDKYYIVIENDSIEFQNENLSLQARVSVNISVTGFE